MKKPIEVHGNLITFLKFKYYLDAIVSKMRLIAAPSCRILESLVDYEKFLETDDHTIIGMKYREVNLEED